MSDLTRLAADIAVAAGTVPAAMSAVLAKAAYDIVADAQTAAPVDTGHLRASLGTPTVTPTSAEIGPTAEYGGYVELGTSRAAPHPYLRPAFDRNVEPFITAIGQAAAGLL